jgi:hypothetical protein
MVRKQYPVSELANQMPRRTARKKGSGYENESVGWTIPYVPGPREDARGREVLGTRMGLDLIKFPDSSQF